MNENLIRQENKNNKEEKYSLAEILELIQDRTVSQINQFIHIIKEEKRKMG